MKSIPVLAGSGLKNFSVALLAAVALTAANASAQSAEGFDTSSIEPAEAPAPAAEVPAAVKETIPLPVFEKVPSRYAGSGPELAAYVERLAAMASISKRTTDPFGRYQDPDFKAPEPQIINSGKAPTFTKEPPVPFADVIAAIEVNMVIPAQKRFLVSTPAGARSMKLGDAFPIQLPNGKKVRVQVKSVTSAAIQFVNLDTGETGILKPDVMPQGMQKGTGGITAPGMQPDGPDAPLEIQTGPNFSNR